MLSSWSRPPGTVGEPSEASWMVLLLSGAVISVRIAEAVRRTENVVTNGGSVCPAHVSDNVV